MRKLLPTVNTLKVGVKKKRVGFHCTRGSLNRDLLTNVTVFKNEYVLADTARPHVHTNRGHRTSRPPRALSQGTGEQSSQIPGDHLMSCDLTRLADPGVTRGEPEPGPGGVRVRHTLRRNRCRRAPMDFSRLQLQLIS